jgi:hypothetical protein
VNLQVKPRYWKIIFVPALITLGITILRLCAELMELPAWLANRGVGGPGALIGISWLPPFLGVYFAVKLAGSPGNIFRPLFKTLLLYGLAARIPVIIIMGLAIFGNWGTHYDAFAPGAFVDATPMVKFLQGGVAIQLVFWLLVWTVGSGMLTGLVTSWIRSRRAGKTGGSSSSL